MRDFKKGRDSMQKTDIGQLETRRGYSFKSKALLREALTHSSYAHEMKSKRMDAQCNERLEFLGDSVLSLVTSEYLFSKYIVAHQWTILTLR